jgi:hypothetical protein
MNATTFSSRQFNQDTSRAKQAAELGPVIITDRGKPAHVLLSIAEYQRLTAGTPSLIDLLAMPGVEEIDFIAPRASGFTRPADLG